ncbi:MAG: RNA polymerase sporulation sigma factor SigK [Lachnospiraceae bacterium]|nr:RNA polymerase sporulation sigma factor SigK [Lachnospiraceae bacterium]MCI9134678.1 RNA polymerase sporulation sigma factor SigK [Lachnospiraceae bacterium]
MKVFPKPLTAEEESCCLQKFKKGDIQARNILVEHNLRLVAHIVKKYQGAEDDTEDLISIGTIGLIKAVSTFDEGKGKLATYAAKCIENELLMFMRSKKKTSRETSYYEPIGTDKEGNEIHLLDVIESEERDAFTQISLKTDSQKAYGILSKDLTDRERQVLVMRYGLYGQREYTQREIADQLGISRSYVSRIEKKAVEKLRRGMECAG